MNGVIDEAKGTIIGSFQRSVAGNVETIPIQSVRVVGNNSTVNVYVVIYVDDIPISNTPPVNTENIIGVEWNVQHPGTGAQLYNQFSQQAFPYVAPPPPPATTATTTNPGGGGKKRKSKKTRAKKHYRHKKTQKRRKHH